MDSSPHLYGAGRARGKLHTSRARHHIVLPCKVHEERVVALTIVGNLQGSLG